MPRLVRASTASNVRGVYLDRKRGLWRANWREDGKVRTKVSVNWESTRELRCVQGFRMAQWGDHGAELRAIEVRKVMETRACFLRLRTLTSRLSAQDIMALASYGVPGWIPDASGETDVNEALNDIRKLVQQIESLKESTHPTPAPSSLDIC